MTALVDKVLHPVIVGIPLVEFVDLTDRLPQMHPGVAYVAVLLSVLVLIVCVVARRRRPGKPR